MSDWSDIGALVIALFIIIAVLLFIVLCYVLFYGAIIFGILWLLQHVGVNITFAGV